MQSAGVREKRGTLPPNASGRSQAGRRRRSAALSRSGFPHSGQRPSTGKPLRTYPQPSQSRSDSVGTEAARDIILWYTRRGASGARPFGVTVRGGSEVADAAEPGSGGQDDRPSERRAAQPRGPKGGGRGGSGRFQDM